MATPDLHVRPFTADELPTAYALLARVFGDEVRDADVEAERSVFELDRSLAAFDGDSMVACMGAYSHAMSVPGGELPVAGTTWVAVSPTHRRRGILSGMIRRHLEDVAARGEPLAALWASEAPIYGRFGYGIAIEQVRTTVAIDAGLAWLPSAPPPAEQVRVLPLEGAAAVLDPIYEAARRRRAGAHRRSEAWWGFNQLSDRAATRFGATGKHVAVAEVDGRDAAYAIYGLKPDHRPDGRVAGAVRIREMAGVDPAAEAAMWRFLLAHDLVTEAVAWARPADDPLPWLLTDPRRVVRQPGDTLHVRIVDLPAALRGRAYAESVGFTVEVTDPLLEANDGTWRVEVAPEGASVEPAEGSAPDLRMDVRALGSLYMGDIPLRQLAAAGVVEVRDRAVVRPVDAAFTAEEAGWVPEVW